MPFKASSFCFIEHVFRANKFHANLILAAPHIRHFGDISFDLLRFGTNDL